MEIQFIGLLARLMCRGILTLWSGLKYFPKFRHLVPFKINMASERNDRNYFITLSICSVNSVSCWLELHMLFGTLQILLICYKLTVPNIVSCTVACVNAWQNFYQLASGKIGVYLLDTTKH